MGDVIKEQCKDTVRADDHDDEVDDVDDDDDNMNNEQGDNDDYVHNDEDYYQR